MIKLLDITACPDEILRHNLASVLQKLCFGDLKAKYGCEMNQLSSFGALFDIHDEFLLALLELCAFTVKFSLSFGQ